jgi:hypothetical protein
MVPAPITAIVWTINREFLIADFEILRFAEMMQQKNSKIPVSQNKQFILHKRGAQRYADERIATQR